MKQKKGRQYVLMFHCNNQWYKLDAQLQSAGSCAAGRLEAE